MLRACCTEASNRCCSLRWRGGWGWLHVPAMLSCLLLIRLSSRRHPLQSRTWMRAPPPTTTAALSSCTGRGWSSTAASTRGWRRWWRGGCSRWAGAAGSAPCQRLACTVCLGCRLVACLVDPTRSSIRCARFLCRQNPAGTALAPDLAAILQQRSTVWPCLAQECQGLLEAGVKPNSNCASRAIGYRQAIDFLMVSGLLGGWLASVWWFRGNGGG